MLDFIENYYEVTVSNKEVLRQLMIAEDVQCTYDGDPVKLDKCLCVGYVLGNFRHDGNPKHAQVCLSTNGVSNTERYKITTRVTKPLMKME